LRVVLELRMGRDNRYLEEAVEGVVLYEELM
jgi:hypothetical protein